MRYVCMFWISLIACSAYANSSRAITINGKINSCYDTDNNQSAMVYLSPTVNGPGRTESAPVKVGEQHRFTITVPADQYPYGDYYLRFGVGKDKASYGAERIEIDADEVDLGTLGECDL